MNDTPAIEVTHFILGLDEVLGDLAFMDEKFAFHEGGLPEIVRNVMELSSTKHDPNHVLPDSLENQISSLAFGLQEEYVQSHSDDWETVDAQRRAHAHYMQLPDLVEMIRNTVDTWLKSHLRTQLYEILSIAPGWIGPNALCLRIRIY